MIHRLAPSVTGLRLAPPRPRFAHGRKTPNVLACDYRVYSIFHNSAPTETSRLDASSPSSTPTACVAPSIYSICRTAVTRRPSAYRRTTLSPILRTALGAIRSLSTATQHPGDDNSKTLLIGPNNTSPAALPSTILRHPFPRRTQIRDQTHLALRPSRHANIAAVQDQPMVGAGA